jgi:hypothetical protein
VVRRQSEYRGCVVGLAVTSRFTAKLASIAPCPAAVPEWRTCPGLLKALEQAT